MHIDENGYCKIWKNGRFVRLHREIYKHYLKILFDEDIEIPANVDIHHIDGNKQNNALINLQPLLHGSHSIISNIKDLSSYFCLRCGSKKTYIQPKNDRPNWYKYKHGVICKNCYELMRYHKRK